MTGAVPGPGTQSVGALGPAADPVAAGGSYALAVRIQVIQQLTAEARAVLKLQQVSDLFVRIWWQNLGAQQGDDAIA